MYDRTGYCVLRWTSLHHAIKKCYSGLDGLDHNLLAPEPHKEWKLCINVGIIDCTTTSTSACLPMRGITDQVYPRSQQAPHYGNKLYFWHNPISVLSTTRLHLLWDNSVIVLGIVIDKVDNDNREWLPNPELAQRDSRMWGACQANVNKPHHSFWTNANFTSPWPQTTTFAVQLTPDKLDNPILRTTSKRYCR